MVFFKLIVNQFPSLSLNRLLEGVWSPSWLHSWVNEQHVGKSGDFYVRTLNKAMLYPAPDANITSMEGICSVAVINYWTVVYCRDFKIPLLKQGLFVPSKDVHDEGVQMHELVWVG